MEVLGVLLIPLALAYLVAPIAAFFMALGNRKVMVELTQRLTELERRAGITPSPAATAPAAPPVETQPPRVGNGAR